MVARVLREDLVPVQIWVSRLFTNKISKMKIVKTKKKNLADYQKIVDKNLIMEIKQSAKKLKDKKILHINATASGGGVAEILSWLTPLMNGVGLKTEWRVMDGAGEFFDVTKIFHNAMQGEKIKLTPIMKSIYYRYNKLNADLFKKINNYNFVIIHDPQPAGLINFIKKSGKQTWIWQAHAETQSPCREVWDFFKPMLEKYNGAIFARKRYIRKELKIKKIDTFAQAIDPLSDKNKFLDKNFINKAVKKLGLDIKRPIITQVSRFDPWKDPLGVIRAYKIVKGKIPEAQLVLMGNIPEDAPEGWKILDEIKKMNNDPDLHILHMFCDDKELDLKVNAIQRASDVIIQKSLKEGFGLTVSEALWKQKPVVGGNTGGITLQIQDGENGFLVDSTEECAEKIIWLLQHPKQSEKMGKKGKETVRKKFTCIRYLRDYLNFLTKF